MIWRRVVPGAALLALAYGCGDDSSTSMPTDTGGSDSGMDSTTGSPTSTDTVSDPDSGSTTDPGTTTDPGSTGTDTNEDDTGSSSTGSIVPCEYPEDAVEPMAINEVLFPYSWPEALHADGSSGALNLEDAPCGIDDVIDWSPHDVLLFISVPAW